MTNRSVFRAAALASVLALALSACSDDDTSSSSPTNPGSRTDTEASLELPSFDTVKTTPLSTGEHDRLLGATFDAQNRLYGAGWVGAGADQMMAVARYGPNGQLDTTFGTAGVASVNVAKGGKAVELARGVVVQASGKIVISGMIEHDPTSTGDPARDTDIALARFDQNGKLDPTFGTEGVVRLDLSTGIVDGTAFRGDTAWGLTGLSDGKLVVVGSQLGVGVGRKDTDFAVVRLSVDGVRDTTFGTNGVAVVGVGTNVSESPKNAIQMADGKIVATGYASLDGIVKVVLFRLTTAGALDPTFGANGISVNQLLGNVAESYGVAQVGNRLVTTGYGKDTAEAKVDMISGGFDLNGKLDPTFGTNGTVRVDVAGDDDRGRTVIGLPSGGALIVGSGKPTATNLEGMVVRLTPAGQLDAAFGTNGRRLLDIGGPNDAFFGAAVSPDKSRIAVVGYLGRDTAGSDKDDSAILFLKP